MKTLRSRLFFSIGGVFLIVAILNYFLPKIFVTHDVDKGAAYLKGKTDEYQKKIIKLTTSWVTYRFLNMAAQLNAASHALELKNINSKTEFNADPWHMAATAIRTDPEIAFVQVSSPTQSAIITPEGASLYLPSWARDGDKLWIRLSPGDIFLATPLEGQKNTFLLYKPRNGEERTDLQFISFLPLSETIPLKDQPQGLYDQLRVKENLLLQKTELIEQLLPWHQKAEGILRVDADFKQGIALLSRELFSDHLFAEPIRTEGFLLVHRKEGDYVDLAQWVLTGESPSQQILIGFSLSTICSEIGKMIQKPILLYYHGKLIAAFTIEGKDLPLQELSFDQGKIIWDHTIYAQSPVQIADLDIDILTPLSEVEAIPNFLKKLRDSLIAKISGNLLAVSIGVFGLALLLLARISKRIARPIALLAEASEEIGKGKYDDLHLPAVEKREDEVATLTHSFHKMVGALRDREKIRGVLNKVVSKEIASRILSSSIELGGEERNLTILFSDIRGFTPLSEKLDPQTLIGLLNTYMTRMCRIIDETNGVVDKFIGDAIMALYGAPLPLEHHAEKAVEAALHMMENLKLWNEERGVTQPQIKVGIGIHTGLAFSGNMGAENRLNYTVVGANVNLASRLCSAAAPMEILISEDTYRALPNPHKFKIIKRNPIPLKGIDHLVPIYAISNT